MTSVHEIVSFFETLALFRGLGTSELEDVARVVQPFEHGPGQTLFEQGADFGWHVYHPKWLDRDPRPCARR